MNSRKFNIEPEQVTPEVIVKHYETSSKKVKFCCKMNQIPANSNDTTTGHKLQGMSKDIIIVSSWPIGGLSKVFKNWEYVVLSHVRTLSGLCLIEPIDMDKLFNPSPELRFYIEKARKKDKQILKECQIAMSKITWTQFPPDIIVELK
jgi:hypothetical protein